MCFEHQKEKDEGKIIKCECGTWHYSDEKCPTCTASKKPSTNWLKFKNNFEPKEKQDELETNCIICGAPTKIGKQCKNCYQESMEHIDNLDKNATFAERRDHYYNLKDSIYRTKDFDKVKSNCNRLIAIALLNQKLTRDNALVDKVFKDVQEIIEKKRPKEELAEEIIEKIKETDEHRDETERTLDGHYVKSGKEKEIDDLLYQATIPHSYGQKVFGISERSVVCDWFIPVVGILKGVYIEYWGMNTESYKKNKEEKIKLYKKHNIPLIEIEKDDLRDSGFIATLINEIKRKATEKFGITDFNF